VAGSPRPRSITGRIGWNALSVRKRTQAKILPRRGGAHSSAARDGFGQRPRSRDVDATCGQGEAPCGGLCGSVHKWLSEARRTHVRYQRTSGVGPFKRAGYFLDKSRMAWTSRLSTALARPDLPHLNASPVRVACVRHRQGRRLRHDHSLVFMPGCERTAGLQWPAVRVTPFCRKRSARCRRIYRSGSICVGFAASPRAGSRLATIA
jgi:hypothetical protein